MARAQEGMDFLAMNQANKAANTDAQGRRAASLRHSLRAGCGQR